MPERRERRDYSEEDRAVAMAAYEANGKNLARTARFCQIPRNTLRKWVQGGATNSVTPAVSRLRQQKKGELADRLESAAHRLVGILIDGEIEGGVQAITVALGILVDKMQILRGKPSEITYSHDLTEPERASRVAALLDAARARRAGQPDPPPGEQPGPLVP